MAYRAQECVNSRPVSTAQISDRNGIVFAWARPLKLFKGVLHDGKGDANLQGFRVTDPLDFEIPERLAFISGWVTSSGASGC
jgi:hypothetical protein